jgi:hypothetical protein
MKYSLRSLIIGVTLFCVVVGGRIEYLRRWAVYHEIQAAHADSGMGSAHHHRVSEDYRKAMIRPWTTLNEFPVPKWMLDEIKRKPVL